MNHPASPESSLDPTLAAVDSLARNFILSTYVPRARDIERRWLLVDADGEVLGRLASQVAAVLRGKHQPFFSPNLDTGDHVVVINASKVVMTAGKAGSKFHYRHSGYPGGLKRRSYGELMEVTPEEVVRRAVRGMLSKNTLGRQQLGKLKVYAGPDHPHDAQSPEPMELLQRVSSKVSKGGVA